MYAVLDIETTGGNFRKEAITEVAILLFDGNEICDSWNSLINPGRSIPVEISRLTGITNEMVRYAPSFPEVARKIVEITENCILVGHNISFDYSFIRESFRQLAYNYRRETLCTLKMSRKAFPGLPSYSLGRLCLSLGIVVNNRHRAGGDAMATLELFQLILKDQPALLNVGQPVINGNIRREILAGLPQTAGVYFFHNEEGKVIYVGKSNDIHKRVISHFANDKTVKGASMREKILDVSYEITGSETLALLRESAEIKRLMPVFNTQGRRKTTTYGLFCKTDKNGYLNLSIAALGKQNDPVFTFSTKTEGRNFLLRLWESYSLCQKLCGMYKSSTACFHHSIGQCQGACIGAELSSSYNSRVESALERYRFQVNNFVLVDFGRTNEERCVMLVSKGEYQGYAYVSPEFLEQNHQEIADVIINQPHDRDARMIIRQAVRNGSYLKVIPLERT